MNMLALSALVYSWLDSGKLTTYEACMDKAIDTLNALKELSIPPSLADPVFNLTRGLIEAKATLDGTHQAPTDPKWIANTALSLAVSMQETHGVVLERVENPE